MQRIHHHHYIYTEIRALVGVEPATPLLLRLKCLLVLLLRVLRRWVVTCLLVYLLGRGPPAQSLSALFR